MGALSLEVARATDRNRASPPTPCSLAVERWSVEPLTSVQLRAGRPILVVDEQ